MTNAFWRLGSKSDRQILAGLTCCPADHLQQRDCPQPWAHCIQTYFRDHKRAIASLNRRPPRFDQRMILAFKPQEDGDQLAAAAVHALDSDDDPEGPRVRVLMRYAVDLRFQGKELSHSVRTSQYILDAVVNDIETRHEPNEVVHLLAQVAPENTASVKCLERYGLTNKGIDHEGMHRYSGRIL